MSSAIAVEYDFSGWSTTSDGHVQCVGDQLGSHVVGHGPSDDHPGVQIDDGGQVRPAVPGPYVSNIAAPFGVRLGRREVAADEVRCPNGAVSGDGGAFPRLRVAAFQTCDLHEPPHPLVRDPVAAGGEFRTHAPNAGTAVEVLVVVLDQRC